MVCVCKVDDDTQMLKITGKFLENQRHKKSILNE